MNNLSFYFSEDLREIPESISDWNNYIESLKVKLSTTQDEVERMSLLGEIGSYLRVINRLDEAKNYLEEALKIGYRLNDNRLICTNLIRLAHTFHWQEKYLEAQNVFFKVQTILANSFKDDSLQAFYHQHLAKLYFDQNFYLKASIEFLSALNIRKKLNSKSDLIDSSFNSLEKCKSKLRESLDCKIRNAKFEDLRAIAKIEESWCGDNGASYDDFLGFFNQMGPKEKITVIEYDNEVIGFIGTQEVSDNKIYIWNLGILPLFRKFALATVLIQDVIKRSKENSLSQVFLEVAHDNLAAINLYKKLGFSEISKQENYYSEGSSSLRFEYNFMYE